MHTASELDGTDFLYIEKMLSCEERLLQDTIRSFVRARVLPSVGQWFEEGVFPHELAREFGRLGILGMHLRGFDCAGSSAVAYGLCCLELEAGDSGLRSFASVQGSLAMYAVYRWGDDEQKEVWLPRMSSGEIVGCFGLTEPDFGSDPSGMRTYARQDGSDWILNGTKAWITNGSIADVAIVWAQTDGGIRGFIVPTNTKGFSTSTIGRKLSLRVSVTSELIMQDCRVTTDALLPTARGLHGPLSCLNEARFGVLWGAMGAARACYESALEYAKTRTQFGHLIGSFQLTQQKLVDMLVELSKGTLLALQLGRMKDEGDLHPAQVSLGKLNNVREALAIARQARTILGANGVTLEYPVMRHMANLESVLTYEGTSEMHSLIVGKKITGLDAFS